MLGVSIDDVWNTGPLMAPKPTKTSRDAVPIGHVSNMTRGNSNYMVRGEFHDAAQQQQQYQQQNLQRQQAPHPQSHHQPQQPLNNQVARRPQMQIAPPTTQRRPAPQPQSRPEPEFDPEYVSDLEKAFNYLERQNAALQRELEKQNAVKERFAGSPDAPDGEVKCQRDYWNLTLLIVIIVLLLILIVLVYRSHQRLAQFSQIGLLGPQASLL